jgi:hypothetical protein
LHRDESGKAEVNGTMIIGNDDTSEPFDAML